MRRLRFLPLVAALVYLAWFGAPRTAPFSGYGGVERSADYYNLLTEGFQSGHLWMNIPEVPAGKAPETYNDASFYRGHYYLYFGPTPVVLFFLPFKMLTGRELPLGLPILLSICVGVVLQAWILSDARRRYFPRLCPRFEALLLVLLALGSACPVLLAVENIYETAIAVGYLCLSVTWYGFYRAAHAEKAIGGWLVLASASAGLAVGSRPSMLLVFPALAIGTLWLLGRARSAGHRLGIAAAAVVPAALIGFALAGYNVARFGKLSELGVSYQMNPLNGAHQALVSPRFIPANLSWYYLRAPGFSPYFPFVLPVDTHDAPKGYGGIEWVHGQLAFPLLLVAAVMAAQAGRRKGEGMDPVLKAFTGLVALAGLLVLGFLCCAGVRADRYVVDCQGSFVLALALFTGWAASRLGWKGRSLPALLVAAVSVSNLLIPYSFADAISERRSRELPAIERTLNLPSYLAFTYGFLHYGPRKMVVRFPERAQALVEPLISSGSTLGRDGLQSVRLEAGTEQFIFTCGNRGDFKSREIPIIPGRAYTLEVDMGSFYPPRHHPFFDGWSAKDVEAVKTTARVAVDGTEVMRARLPFHDSPPDNVRYGVGAQPGLPVFSGTIVSNVRLPLRDMTHDPALVEQGLWKIRLEPILRGRGLRLPVLGAGRHGEGVLLFTQTLDGRSLRFAVDAWGTPVVYSPPVEVAIGYHTLTVLECHQALAVHPAIASRLTAAQRAALDMRLLIWWDGRRVWDDTLPYYQDVFDAVAVGANPQQFSSAEPVYAGAFFPQPVTDDEVQAAIDEALSQSR